MNPPVPPRVPLHPQAPGENREAARPVSPDAQAQAPEPGTPGPASPSAASGEAAARPDTGPGTAGAGEILAAVAQAVAPDRIDSQLSLLNRCAEHDDVDLVVGPVLGAVVDVALRAALLTSGLVDPTTGGAAWRGLDGLPAAPAPGLGELSYDPATRRLRMARGTVLDLGPAARAWAAEQVVAAAEHDRPGTAVLHRAGDALAVAGPDDDAAVLLERELRAETGLGAAAWARLLVGGRRGVAVVEGPEHAVVNPVTGAAARSPWRQVVVVADRAVEAQAYARAAHLLGSEAPPWVAACGAAGRFAPSPAGSHAAPSSSSPEAAGPPARPGTRR